MKYIRTKDGRILKGSNYGFGVGMPYKNYDVKVADTIEELCDFYVIWLKNRELPLFEKIQKGVRPYPSYFEIGECSFDKGYGAIFTDKGLIYVAKMNEKGELELL